MTAKKRIYGGMKMYGLKEMLEMEYRRLSKVKQLAEKEIKSLPQGAIRLSKSQNQVQCYYRSDEEKSKNGRYLPKSEEQFARRVIQRKYDADLLKLVDKRVNQLKRILLDYQDNEIERIYYNESPLRQAFITPLEKTFQIELQEWMGIVYQGKPFTEKDPVINADKGHRVRSKSEKILADYFYKNNIPYHYEKPLYLEGYGVVYPDFTFYVERYRKEVYWEHEGRMQDADYVLKTIKKQECYEKNGIFMGERLIVTQEAQGYVLNTEEIERKIRKYIK